MNKRKIVVITIIVVALILIAVSSWLIYNKFFKKDTDDTGTDTDTSDTNIVFEDKPSNVLSFQQYANSKGYSPKLAEDGKWGPKTSAAWSKLADDFKKSKGYIPSGFVKGERITARFPLQNAVAYSRTTGKAIGRIKTAVFVKDSATSGWFFATTIIPTGPYKTPTETPVALLIKDWTKDTYFKETQKSISGFDIGKI